MTPRFFARSHLACAVAIALLTPVMIHAQSPDSRSPEQVQAEIARLQKLLDEERQTLEQKQAQAATPAAAPVAVAKSNEPVEAELGKVVVRGRSQRDRLNDVPVATSVVTGAELDRELAVDLQAITRRSASVQFNQNNTRGASLSIRGLGKRSFTETQDPSVGLTVDGVSYGLTQLGNFDFYDVESVEVARGPQGTQGGKGASAGAVDIRTRKPSFTRSADFSLTYGQRDSVLAKANFGGPLVDDLLAWRGSVIADRGRGFYRSDYDPNYSFYNRNRYGGRVQFLLTPAGSNWTARLSADLEPKAPQVENGLTFRHSQPLRFADGSLTDPNGTTVQAKFAGFTNANGVFTGPRSLFVGRTFSGNGDRNPTYTYDDFISNKLLQNENQGQTVTNRGGSLQLVRDGGDFTVTSTSAWRGYSFDAHNDEGTPFDINKNGGGGVEYTQMSQEVLFEGAPSQLFDYRSGVYFLKTDDIISSKAGFGSDAGAFLATNAQYNTLERNAGVNRGAGISLLKDSLDDAYTLQETEVDTKSTAVYGQINWHLTKKLDLLTGVRVTREDRTTEDSKFLTSAGTGAALNPVAVRGVTLGGFASDNAGNLGENSPEQLALADGVAQKFFGATDYAALTTAQKTQVAAAKAVRATAIGALSNPVASNYKDTLLTTTFTPSYKITDNLTAYTSYQHGEKSGSALNVNFVSSNVKPERTDAYEIGLKSILWNGKLNVNADVFYMNIKDYQSAVRVVDIFTTQTNIANNQANPVAYVTAQGNVKRVAGRGFELDAFLSAIPNTTIRLSGAYTDVRYKDFKNAAFPEEQAFLSTPEAPFTDQSGLTLPGISKWNFNLGAEYRRPIFTDWLGHVSFNTSYNSKFNNTDLLSSFGVVGGYSRTDAAIGVTTTNGFDFSLVGRNVFDDRAHEQGFAQFSPYPYPRWFGITVSGKL